MVGGWGGTRSRREATGLRGEHGGWLGRDEVPSRNHRSPGEHRWWLRRDEVPSRNHRWRRRVGPACEADVMALRDPKETLIEYLQTGRDAMVWKLDGLS